MSEVDLRERHRSATHGGLTFRVDPIDEHAHPLIARAVRVHRTTGLARGLDLDAVFTSLDGVVRILTPQHQIRMSVEVRVDGERSGMLGKACRQHVGQHARHDRGPQRVVEPLQPLDREAGVHVIEEVVHVLHSQPEVLQSQLERQAQR